MIAKSETDIRDSYDRQAGSYTALFRNPDHVNHKNEVGQRLASVISKFAPQSVLDAGIGEASTTIPTFAFLDPKPKLLGFDLSPARVEWARKNLQEAGIDATLFTGSLRSIDLPNRAVDVTVTFHAIEPNRGAEEIILRELIRVSKTALVLVEPSFELANSEQKARMDKYGYIRGLPSTLTRLGTEFTSEPWGLDINPLNVAALTIVKL